ncbi:MULTISPECIES: GNAT family N-acetyltransferase [unclassified Bradyrhizobium]|uniref:GNAT family N-acetyltransferase n=1 Tax=unclassified Bradyrhizobium TaxID=2631580 RepID=UPI0024E11AD5|nr:MULTISPECIES: GNAT family N-acetyltransferase [unclassified Bradyrhizobium]
MIDHTIAHASSAAEARHAVRSALAQRCVPLEDVAPQTWQDLAGRALEPNGYYLPGWERAVNASARDHTGSSALCACNDDQPSRLIGLMPVTSLWRAYRLPLPALASGHPYGTLCTPLLDRADPEQAVTRLLGAARRSGARAMLLRDMSVAGPVMQAFEAALRREGLQPRLLQSYERACLDATGEGETVLHDALGAKKLKELRRQRQRLAEHGAVRFEVARSPGEVTAALETFLTLEASGWKGRRGTALVQHDGDAAFIRRAAPALAHDGACEIISLFAGETSVAAGVVLRHQDRAFFFKLGVDERFAKYSPGVQLTLDLTRHLCSDPTIRSADSTAGPDHPMINPIWRGRLGIGDVLIPLYAWDAAVEVIHGALIARREGLGLARRALHALRDLRKRRAATPQPRR